MPITLVTILKNNLKGEAFSSIYADSVNGYNLGKL